MTNANEIWQSTVNDWKRANGFIKDLRSPDLNKPYAELTGLEKACVNRFNSRLSVKVPLETGEDFLYKHCTYIGKDRWLHC